MARLGVPLKTTDSNVGYFRCQMSDLQQETLDANLIRRLQARDVLQGEAATNQFVARPEIPTGIEARACLSEEIG